MTTSHRKISFKRIIALCIAAALTVFAINATITANRLSGRFAQWQTDRPVDALVDLSKPGVTTMPCHETCQSAHSELVFLDVEGIDMNNTDALQGLAGTMTIEYDDKPVVTTDLADIATFTDVAGRHKFCVHSFFPIGTGAYTLKIQVDHPAELLANHPQRVTAQYLLCGLEKFPELITQFFAVISWLLVAAFGVPSIIGWVKYGWRVKP
jgi:hypothetical protein